MRLTPTALAVLIGAAAATGPVFAASTTVTNSDNCKVVHLKPGENPPTTGMSTSITAGNGQVSGQTTTGNGMSVQSSGAGVGASVSSSTTRQGRTTTVTSANGNCTVYVQPNK